MPENTQRISVPAPVLSAPPQTGSGSSGIAVFLVALFCLAIGGAAGFFVHKHLDDEAEYRRYAAELEPLLYYKDRVHAARERGSNETMRIVNFKVYQAYRDGLDLEKLLWMAQPKSKQPPNLSRLNIKRFKANIVLAEEYGIYEGAENLKALAYGRAPYVTKGEYKGQRIDVEHVVPKSLAPGLDNVLANLMWMPASLNQSKSNTITPEAMEMAEIFKDEGILPYEEHVAVREAFGNE